MRFPRTLALGVFGATAWAFAAFAAPMSAEDYQTKLKSYDPAAVAAATNYGKNFDLMGAFTKSAPRVVESLTKQLKDKNPGITDDQIKQFVDTFQQVALVDNADAVNHAVILALLESFSSEEIVALDKFYATPLGQGILKKFPTVTQKLGEARQMMTTEIVPMALDAAKAKLKAAGVEVKM